MARHRTDTSARFSEGARVGDYRIEHELRSEDTGLVYCGTHLVLPRRAAIKVMHPAQAYMRALAVQILREACVLEALSHPGVPRVYECGVLEDKRPWVALELITGDTVADLVVRQPLALADLVLMVKASADVLEHAHARGVVHNRLTDASIVRTPQRAVAFSVRGWGDVVAHDSNLAAEPSGDVHDLGLVAFRALTGSMMREGDTVSAVAPSVPVELAALVDDMVAREPTARPTAAEVRERAHALAATLALDTPRAITSDVPKHVEDSPSSFTIRIHRSGTGT
ncbi:MAG: protein kinase [Deltaproteobacteria bacterium]